MSDAGKYRPSACATCGNEKLHVPCRPERHPKREPSLPPVVAVLQFRCADEACGATWRVLPVFLARHLWHAWQTVERVVRPSGERPAAMAPAVPATTQRRWQGRLASSARVLCVLLAMSGGSALAEVTRSGLTPRAASCSTAFNANAHPARGKRLSPLAALLHRLERGSPPRAALSQRRKLLRARRPRKDAGQAADTSTPRCRSNSSTSWGPPARRVTSTRRTAGCGPACPVVWQGRRGSLGAPMPIFG